MATYVYLLIHLLNLFTYLFIYLFGYGFATFVMPDVISVTQEVKKGVLVTQDVTLKIGHSRLVSNITE